MQNKLHAMLTIGCPNVLGGKGHADFHIEEGKYICACGQDFTKELEAIGEGFLATKRDKFIHAGWHEGNCPAHSSHMGIETACNCIFSFVLEEILK